MRIEITEADFLDGVPADCKRCPVALAVMRQTGAEWAHVNQVGLQTPDRFRLLPQRIHAFIAEYDRLTHTRAFQGRAGMKRRLRDFDLESLSFDLDAPMW